MSMTTIDNLMFTYLRVGTQHQRHHSVHSCELPILCGNIAISKSHFLHNLRHPAISGQVHIQMRNHQMLIKLPRIQADGKLPQRPVNPMSRRKLFPMYHCIALQHDQKIAKGHDLPDELFVWENKFAKIHDKASRRITFIWPISENVQQKSNSKYRAVCLDTPLRSFSVAQSLKENCTWREI